MCDIGLDRIIRASSEHGVSSYMLRSWCRVHTEAEQRLQCCSDRVGDNSTWLNTYNLTPKVRGRYGLKAISDLVLELRKSQLTQSVQQK